VARTADGVYVCVQSRAEDDGERDVALAARFDREVVSAARHVADGVRVLAAAARAGAGHGGAARSAEGDALREALDVADIVRVGRVEAVGVEVEFKHGAALARGAAAPVLCEYPANEIIGDIDGGRLPRGQGADGGQGGSRGVRTARTVSARCAHDYWLHRVGALVYQRELMSTARACA